LDSMKDIQGVIKEIPNIISEALQQAIETLGLSGVEGRLILWKIRYVAECSSWSGCKVIKGKLRWRCGIKVRGVEYELDEAIVLRDEDNLDTIRKRVLGCLIFRLKYAPELSGDII